MALLEIYFMILMCSIVPQFQATPCPKIACCPDDSNESICTDVCTKDVGNWSRAEECEKERGNI